MASTTNSKLGEFDKQQSSFMGGMNRASDPSRIADNEYTLLINGRARYDTIMPIKLPLQLTTGLPLTGNMQGCYGAGSIILIFIDGLAYIRDFATQDNFFRQIPLFQMSADAPILYAELVPASSLNFKRQLVNSEPTSGIKITSIATATPQCVLIQDGVNQPRRILPDGSTQITKKYSEWSDNREYVPIGLMMLYTGDGILHIVAPNRKGIYNSVTGRPLDFMKIVDENGDALPDETEGGAAYLQHPIDYADITCISRIDTPVPGGYLATTARSSYIVAPNLNDLLFGEPKFTNTYLFSTGALNNFSVTDILGDTALIDFAGIRSFNAVTQYRIEGKNSPFYAKIFRIFEGVVQDIVADWNFDNYGFFAVKTIYGYGAVVYDTLLPQWVGLDLYPGVGQIKQFCEIKTSTARLLFFATIDGKFYQCFSGETAVCALYTKEWCTEDTEVEMTPEIIHLIFLDVKESGQVRVTPFINRKRMVMQTKDIVANYTVIEPQAIPFGKSDVDTTENVVFNFQQIDRGWKGGFLIEWNFNADLAYIEILGQLFKSVVSRKQQASYFAPSV